MSRRMTGINLQYTIQYFEDGTACLNATKNNCGESVCSEKKYTIEIPRNPNKILEPIQLGIALQNITSLLIPHCRLSYLPDELNFCNLLELDISYNYFKQVPDFVMYSNSNLKKFNISFNKIKDFYLEPKCYKKIQNLNLRNNEIYDIPQWIFCSSCTSLEILNLSNNPLNKPISLLSGQSLIKLYSLELNNSNLKSDLKFIEEIPYLKNLSVSNNCSKENLNSIQELPFKTFASLSTLVELNFSRLGYSHLSEEICELGALEILNISYNHLSWLPNNFSKLKSLRILNASNNELLSLPSDISELNNLIELHVSHNLIGFLPESITKLYKLKLLDCYSNDLIEDALLIINKIPSLIAFDVEQNSFRTSDEKYLEMRNNIWKDKDRILGSKLVDISSEDDETKSFYSSIEEEREPELEAQNDENINNHEEEIWDCDTDSIGDDSMLILPPYKFRLIKKHTTYNPSDYINPIYFEDALEDET